jgi:hypothetical protein
MELKMNSHLEETFASVVGVCAYIFVHFTGMKFAYLQVYAQPINITDKLINVCFGVVTAIIAYFAVYFIKKYITHESK